MSDRKISILIFARRTVERCLPVVVMINQLPFRVLTGIAPNSGLIFLPGVRTTTVMRVTVDRPVDHEER